ncbi:MAG: hypothetical protein ACRDI2_16570, partial [Chloroflexota bacterium]
MATETTNMSQRQPALSRRTLLGTGGLGTSGVAGAVLLAACVARDGGAPGAPSAREPASIVYTQWGGAPIFEVIDKANATYMQR